MARFSINQQLNGIEIYFERKPDTNVISDLKRRGWRWHNAKRCWYHTNTSMNIEYAEKLCSPAEKGQNTYNSQEEAKRISDARIALASISPEFKTYYEKQKSVKISHKTISYEELDFMESEHHAYLMYLYDCEEIIRQKTLCLINSIGFQKWDDIPYRSRLKINRHFQEVASSRKTADMKSSEITPDLFVAYAVELSLAEEESRYSSWVQQYCLYHYPEYKERKDSAIQEVSIIDILSSAIKDAISSKESCRKLKGNENSKTEPSVERAKNLDTLVYNNVCSQMLQIDINTAKDERHKKYIGLRVGDAFLDYDGYRCVVVEIIRKDPYQGWEDLAPTLAFDNYPSAAGRRRKWDRS